ncbi:MAG: hypothetical protein CM1200mP41_08510 [Gammaproteobacteria bacterium]|nr:MAG: hypothetical protein CM1200mP41_08510 [Gammaproteobacteria bacterium]
MANILQLLKLPDGTVKVLVEGVSERHRKYVEVDEMYVVDTASMKRASLMTRNPKRL